MAENELDLDGWERVRGDVSRLRAPSGWIYAIEYCQGDGYRTRHLFVPAQRGYDQLREMAEQMREQRDAALARSALVTPALIAFLSLRETQDQMGETELEQANALINAWAAAGRALRATSQSDADRDHVHRVCAERDAILDQLRTSQASELNVLRLHAAAADSLQRERSTSRQLADSRAALYGELERAKELLESCRMLSQQRAERIQELEEQIRKDERP